MLIRIMGHDDPSRFRRGEPIPHWFPRESGLSDAELVDLARVAHDGLCELGYEAAAAALRRWSVGPGQLDPRILEVNAKEALTILEVGPPSIVLDSFVVLREPMYRSTGTRWDPNQEVLIAKLAEPSRRPWYRFLVGRPGRNDRSSDVAFYGCYPTLRAAKAAWE